LAGAPIYGLIPGAGEGNLMLTNAQDDSSGFVLSTVFSKSFDWGLDLMLGYAYTEMDDVGSNTSFTSDSSFVNVATNDINRPRAATSNYEVRSRVTLRASFAREFWGDNSTRFSINGFYGAGQPGTYTMTSTDGLQFDLSTRHLLYVPDGPSDPNVIYTDAFDQDEFFAWINDEGLKPGFVTRNKQSSKVSWRLDLRIDQEIPLGVDDLKARAYLKIYNFTNMLNDDWGRQYDARFDSQSIVSLSDNVLDDDGNDVVVGDEPLIGGAYNYDSFTPGVITDLQEFPSLWEMRLGIEINFR
jgi:hypothetical protein